MTSLTLAASPASAGSQVNTNSCQNSATGTFTDVAITTIGVATPNPATGGVVTLRDTKYEAFFDAAVLIAGYNLGLLTTGVNTIPGTLNYTLNASNTVEGSRDFVDIPLSGQTTITDPDGTPGTGDETGTDLGVSIPVPASVWTPDGGGDIEFSDGGAVILASVFNGLIKVKFTCSVGTSTPAGCVADSATDCTGFDPVAATPFETVTVPPPTPPVCGNTTLDVTEASSATIPLAPLCSDANNDLDASSFAIVQPADGTVTVDAAGNATYTAGSLVAGETETFGFTADDDAGTGPSDEATITVNIVATNPPVCTGGTLSVVAGTSETISLADLCDDADDDLDSATFEISTDPVLGTASVDAGVAAYVAPTTDGSDSFGFTVKDSAGNTSVEATVTVTISPVPATTTTTTTTIAPPTTVPPPTTTAPPEASKGSYTTECSNSVTADLSTLDWTISAIAPATATVGDSVVVSAQNWSVTVPGSVFDAGVNLDLIVDGQVATADVSATLAATNTAESSATQSGIPISLTVVLDADGKAKDAVASFAVDDMTFKATGGDIALAMGDVSMAVDIGLPFSIDFTCAPIAGQAAFHTVAVSGATVAAAQELAFTGVGSSLMIALGGLLILDLGYMAFSAARPRRRNGLG